MAVEGGFAECEFGQDTRAEETAEGCAQITVGVKHGRDCEV